MTSAELPTHETPLTYRGHHYVAMVYPPRDGYVPVSVVAVRDGGEAEVIATGGRTAKRLYLAHVTQRIRLTPSVGMRWDPNAERDERRLVDGVWTPVAERGKLVRLCLEYDYRPSGDPVFSPVSSGLLAAVSAAIGGP